MQCAGRRRQADRVNWPVALRRIAGRLKQLTGKPTSCDGGAMHRIKLLTILLVSTLGVFAGCAETTGTATVAGWTSTPAYAVLRSISASTATKFEIYFANPTMLNHVDSYSTRPRSTMASGTERPPAESAFDRYTLLGFECYRSRFVRAVGPDAGPGGVPAALVSVAFGTSPPTPANQLSVCVGPRQPVPGMAARTTPTTTSALAGVTGYVDLIGWTGFRADDQRRFVVGKDVPAAEAESVVNGKAVPSSLVDDPQVQAVLKPGEGSASLFIGTELLQYAPKVPGSSKVKDAIGEAEKTTGKTLPAAQFSGFAWTPGSGVTGTAAFITVYGSDADAQTAVTVLNTILQNQQFSGFAGGSTVASGSSVVTSVPDVRATAFDFRNLRLFQYPGYHSN